MIHLTTKGLILFYTPVLFSYLDHFPIAHGLNISGFKVRNCLDEHTYLKYLWPRRIPFEMSMDKPNVDTIWVLYALYGNRTEKYIKNVRLSGILTAFNIEPFELKMGDYKIHIFAVLNNIHKVRKTCYLRIRPEGALAVIYGGTSRNISPGEDIVVDGGLSLDFCKAKNKQALTYKWECQQEKTGGFCTNHTGNGPKFSIPERFVRDNDIFTVKLTVGNEDKRVSVTYQQIVVKRNSRHLTIWCTDNCAPMARSPSARRRSSFAAQCEKYCEEACHVKWYVYKGTSNPVSIATSEICPITSCAFSIKDIGDYKVVVECVGKTTSGQASLAFSVEREPVFFCKLNRKQGTSSDIFYLSCNFDAKEEIDYFEVFTADNKTEGIGEFITSWLPPTQPKFRLGPYVTKIYVRATNINGTIGQQKLSVLVTPYLDIKDNTPPIPQITSQYFGSKVDSVRYAIDNENNIEEAIVRIRNLWDNIYAIGGKVSRNKDYREFIYNLKLYAIDALNKIPFTTYDRLSQVTAILQRIIFYQTPRKTDPLLAKSLTAICKKLAYDMRKLLRLIQFPVEVDDKTTFISNTLLECGIQNSNENTDLLSPLPLTFNEEKHEPVPFEETITEDYKIYEEFDDQYYQNLQNIVETINNSLKTNLLMSQNIALTIPDHTRNVIKKTSDMQQLIYRHQGYKYTDRIRIDDVEITPSSDIFNYKDTICLSLMAWTKNIFWFSSNKAVPITHIINLDFIHLETNRLIAVKSPHIITLKIIRLPRDLCQNISGVVKVPLIYFYEREDEEYMEKYVNIHRVNLFRHQALKVEFLDLEQSIFSVVVKNFEVPSYQDFKNSSTIFDREHSSRYYRNDNNYDSWFYVAILPTREMLRNAKQNIVRFPYKIAFSSSSCYSWNFVNEWDRTCKVGTETNDTHISCECNHLSVISADRQAARSTFLDIDWWVNVKMEVEKQVYYAADNLFWETYAYLIVVQTGGHRKNTARVVIKIMGAEGISRHVLNYPDPECKILQHGIEDWIVVTTEESLGNITSIVLWHDNYGIEPIWVCKNIVIYDMQTHERWFFKINDTMSSYHKKIIVAEPVKIKRRLRGVFKERHSWRLFSEDVHRTHTYIERLTLIYSKLITPLLIAMFCYGLPAFEPADSIDLYTRFFPDGFCVAVTVLGSFGSFFLHTVITSILKGAIIYLIIPMIMISNTLLIAYGFWIPYYTDIHILAAWLIGVILDILLYENVLRLIEEYIYGTTKISDPHSIDFNYVDREVQIQREFAYQEVGNTYVRTLESLHRLSIAGAEMKENVDVLRIQSLRYQFTELLVFGFYIIFLYMSVLMAKDTLAVYNHDAVRDLTVGIFTRSTPTLTEVDDIPQIYNYVNNTLIEGMQSDRWYEGFYLQDPGLLSDFSTKYIGVARIRQHRIRGKPCDSYELSRFLTKNKTCFPGFSDSDEDRRSFDGSWDRPTTNPLTVRRLRKMWDYSRIEESGTYRYYGHFANYPGGGYSVHLGRTKQNSLINFQTVATSNWIDRLTRSIVIEFLTYNPNYNMFASVRITIERSAVGLLHTQSLVYPVRMLFVKRELESAAIIMAIIFALWVAVLLFSRTSAIVRRGLMYLTSFWNLLDLIIVGLSIVAIVMYIVRIIEIQNVISILEDAKHNQFVKYFHLFHMNQALQFIAATLVLIATIRLWKLLRFFRMFQIFENTFRFGLAPFMVLTAYHIIITFAFSASTYIIFGDRQDSFRSVKRACESLIRIYMANFHDYDFYMEHETYSVVGLSVITFYMILAKPIYRTYVATEMIAYIDAGLYQDERHTYSFINYLKDQILFVFSVYKNKIKRLRGGLESKNKVRPKKHDIFFANCVSTTTSAIKTMTFISRTVLRNIVEPAEDKETLTDEEANTMLQICHYFLVNRSIFGDSKEVFFKAYHRDVRHKGSKRLKFIDHRRMTAARIIVESILKSTEPEKPKDVLIYEQDIVMNANKELIEQVMSSLKKCLLTLNNIRVR